MGTDTFNYNNLNFGGYTYTSPSDIFIKFDFIDNNLTPKKLTKLYKKKFAVCQSGYKFNPGKPFVKQIKHFLKGYMVEMYGGNIISNRNIFSVFDTKEEALLCLECMQ